MLVWMDQEILQMYSTCHRWLVEEGNFPNAHHIPHIHQLEMAIVELVSSFEML